MGVLRQFQEKIKKFSKDYSILPYPEIKDFVFHNKQTFRIEKVKGSEDILNGRYGYRYYTDNPKEIVLFTFDSTTLNIGVHSVNNIEWDYEMLFSPTDLKKIPEHLVCRYEYEVSQLMNNQFELKSYLDKESMTNCYNFFDEKAIDVKISKKFCVYILNMKYSTKKLSNQYTLKFLKENFTKIK